MFQAFSGVPLEAAPFFSPKLAWGPDSAGTPGRICEPVPALAAGPSPAVGQLA